MQYLPLFVFSKTQRELSWRIQFQPLQKSFHTRKKCVYEMEKEANLCQQRVIEGLFTGLNASCNEQSEQHTGIVLTEYTLHIV